MIGPSLDNYYFAKTWINDCPIQPKSHLVASHPLNPHQHDARRVLPLFRTYPTPPKKNRGRLPIFVILGIILDVVSRIE